MPSENVDFPTTIGLWYSEEKANELREIDDVIDWRGSSRSEHFRQWGWVGAAVETAFNDYNTTFEDAVAKREFVEQAVREKLREQNAE